ncbi:three component ABC system middle component [Serratia proteamaculans]|uniref:three component ABC system middle component n=1 Tax=Serratia proteamaculans TaxID=28151 RepID=UPI002178BF2D|nr:three component ABC system middle component [Serratia proteamaculans]CAI0900324.1 Uncharacterised protein [Serratia proteamaculans]CAI2088647.1 Uncharacterised protein [Serratia proteamaculans]
MRSNFDEIEKLINNPSLGAYLLWVFCKKYQDRQEVKKGVPPAYLFCILTLLFDEDIRKTIASTQVAKGLRFSLAKLEKSKSNKTDILFSISKKIKLNKERSFESILVGLYYGILILNKDTGYIFSIASDKLNIFNHPQEMNEIIISAEKLGCWFSNHDALEIQEILRIKF